METLGWETARQSIGRISASLGKPQFSLKSFQLIESGSTQVLEDNLLYLNQ